MFRKSTISNLTVFSIEHLSRLFSSVRQSVLFFGLIIMFLFISWTSMGQQATNITIEPVPSDPNSLKFNWTNGGGAGRIVIIKNTAGVFTPENGTDIAGLGFSSDFSAASDLDPGAGEVKGVYSGTAATITVTNLPPNTPYYIKVYEWSGASTSPTYDLTATATNPRGFTFFTTDGTFNVPLNISSVTVQALGGGGGGGGADGNTSHTRAGGGGAGGSYTLSSSTSVTGGANISVTVGNGGTGGLGGNDADQDDTPADGTKDGVGSAGETSDFGGLVSAIGGAGGGAGIPSNETGDASATTTGTTFNGGGGAEAPGDGSNATASGAGGGSAGTGGSGTAASGSTAGTGGTGGGGGGAPGITSAGNASIVGGDATELGGGGSGGLDKFADALAAHGGDGAPGYIIVSFTDNTAPAGYSANIDQAIINDGNESAVSFTFAGAEVGATYHFSIDDTNGGTAPITGSGTIITATDQITGIDVSSLDDDVLTLTVHLTDNAANQGSDATDNVTKDTSLPTGYSVSIDQALINAGNQAALSFTFAGAEVGTDYNYSIDDANGGTSAVVGSGTIVTATDQVTGIDVSSLDDGTLTLTVYLTDPQGNQGTDVTDNVSKDLIAPSGYTVSIDQTSINAGNQAALSFTFAGAEVGADYDYSIDDANGGTPAVTGSGTIATATDQITGIDVSTLDDGALTLTVFLTDAAGNQGSDATDNVSKDVVIPTGYTVSIDPSSINSGNQTALSFTFAGAEVGADYDYSIDDANGGTLPVTGNGTVATATDQITGIDVSSLDDGTLTLTVFLTDNAGNQGADATDNISKDAIDPTGYTVSIDQAFINSGNQNALSFTFAGAEVGADYDYSIDDANGGTPAVTGSGTIVTATDQITGINVSSLDDGTLTLTVFLTDPQGNQGADVTDNITKDLIAPTGYTVSIDQTFINAGNQTALSFTFAGAEVGVDYDYSIDDANGGTPAVTGGGTIVTATDQITAINVSSLDNGTLTLTVFLTDPQGNQGSDAIDNLTKDTTIPVFTSTAPAGGALVNTANISYTLSETITSGTITWTEVGGGALDINSPHTQNLAGSELTSGVHNNITLTDNPVLVSGTPYTIDFNGTDAAGNVATTVSNTPVLFDNTPPALSPDEMTFNANGAGAETIVFTISEELNLAEGASVSGFSTSAGSIATAIYSGKNTTNTITLTSAANGQWTTGTTVSYSAGDAVDLAGNAMADIINHAVILNVVNLSAGSIAFTSFKSDDPNTFAVVFLKDVSSGTTIKFTDNGWTSANTLRTTEQTFTWTADADYFAGTEIVFTGNSTGGNPGTVTASHGNITPAGVGSEVLISSSQGDQILAYQGSSTAPTFLAAIQFNNTVWDANATDDQTSALPAGLTNGTHALALGDVDNGAYVVATGVTGSVTSLLSDINNSANWDTDNNPNNVTFPAAGLTNYILPPDLISINPLSPANGSVVPGNLPNLTITFDDNVSAGVTTGNDIALRLDNGTLIASWNVGTPSVSIAGATITVNTGALALTNGQVYEIDVAPRVFLNADGNGNASITGDTQWKFSADAVKPTLTPVTITSSLDNASYARVGETITLAFTASEPLGALPVVAFRSGGVPVTNTVTVTDLGSNQYTATYVTDANDTQGVITFTVDFVDAPGNTGLQVTATTNSSFVNFDKTLPTATVSVSPGAVSTNTAALTVTVTFSESMNAGVNPAITLAPANANFSAGMGVWSTVVNPNDRYTIVYTHDLTAEEVAATTASANSGSDLAGNVQTVAGTSSAFVIDTQRPTVTSITRANANPTNATSVSYTVVFSEAVTNINAADFTPILVSTESGIPGAGSVSGISTSDNITFTVTVSGVAGDGDIRLDILGTAFVTDAYGNDITTNFTTGEAYTIDQTAPIVDDITLPDANPNNTGSVDFNIVFSEDVVSSGVDVSDFTLYGTASGGTASITNVSGSGTSYTVTVSNISLTGTLGLNLVDDNTIKDVSGNSLGGPLANDGNASSATTYEIILPEPQNHVTAFSIATTTTTSIQLTWADATGTPTPSGYLIAVERGGATATVPSDGTPIVDQTNLVANTTGYLNITSGIQTANFSALLSGENYTFYIYPYTNSGTNIDYKTDGVIPSANSTTLLDNFVWINSSGSSAIEPNTFPSTTTSSGVAVINFRFQVYDNGWGSSDNASTKITEIRIQRDLVNDQVGNWFDALQGAELTDGINTKTGTVDPGGNFMTFSGLYNGSTELFGEVADNTAKYYYLKVILKTSLGGSLPENIDNKSFVFKIRNADLTLASNSSGLNPGNDGHSAAPTSGIGKNRVSVVASQLDFSTNPNPNQFVLSDVTGPSTAPDLVTVPVVRARDVNGNTDVDYSSAVTVTNAGSLPMQNLNALPVNSLTAVNGVITFPSNFRYGDDGNGALTVSDGVISNAVSSAVTVNYSNTSTITPGTFVEPGTFTSLRDQTIPFDVVLNRVFDFNVNDDGGAGGDGSPTRITQIVFTQGTGNDIGDWTEALYEVLLYDGSTTLFGTINPTNLTFSGINANTLGLVNDNTTKNYMLYIRFRSNMGGTLPSTVDNMNLVFEVLDENITLDALSSTFTGTEDENSGASNIAVDIDATQLVFTTQPGTTQNYDIPVSPTPVVEARDINGNRDLDYNNTPVLTSSDNETVYTLANKTLTDNQGVISFDPNLQFTSTGGGINGATSWLKVSDGVILSAQSNNITLNYANTSDIIRDPAFTYSGNSDIDYTAYQSTDIQADANSVVLEQFLLRDGWTSTPDADGTATKLTGIVLEIQNWENLRKLALYNGSTEIKEVDVAATINAVNGQLTLNSFVNPFEAGDDASAELSIRASFKANGVNDNEVIAFKVISIASAANSSQFITTAPIGIESALPSGVLNQTEVIATQLDFTTPASNTNASLNSPFAVVVQARDVNGNVDVDFTGMASTITALTNATGATMSSTPAVVGSNFTSGVFPFPGDFQFTSGNNNDNVTLSIMAGGISNVPPPAPTTPTITLTSSFQSRIYSTLGIQNIDYALAANQASDINLPGDGYIIEQLVLSDGDADGTSGDDDGAATVLNSLTLGITNPQSIRRIALYTNNGAWVEEDEQPGSNITISSGYGQITFSGLSISADDNDPGETFSKTVYVVVTFEDNPADIVDNSVIQINVVGAATGGGSKFRGETGDPLGGSFIGGIATTLAPAQPVDAGAIGAQNTIEVLATSLDFVTPASDYAGTNEPIGPSFTTAPLPSTSAAIVHARDEFGVVDLDFNHSPTISGAGATSSAIFVNGVLDLDGMYYTSSGDGTLKVIADGIDSSVPGPNSIPGQPVNVINVTALPNTNGVLATPNIKGGTPNAVLFGVTFSPDHATTTEPSLKQFKIRFNQPYRTPSYTTLKNFRVTYSENGIYGDSNPVSVIDATVSEAQSPAAGASDFDMVVIDWGANPPLPLFDASGNEKPITFYLVADVDVSANISTPSLKPMLIDPGYTSPPVAANTNIVTTAGTAVADNDPNDATVSGIIEGTEFHFATTRPPVLLAGQGSQTSPFVGQLNVNLPLTEIALEFDVQVWTFDGKAALWDRNSRTKVADLNAINGQYVNTSTPTVNPIRFAVNMLPGKSLKNDSVYYVTIEKGSFDNGTQTGTGISDNGFNFYGGISSNGILYFKIESAFPPNVSDADQVFINPNTGVFSAVFDKRGTGYYMIIQAENYSGTPPTTADIKSPAAYVAANPNSVRSAGSFSINTLNEPQFVPFSRNVAPFTPFAPNKAYHVWIYGENDATPPVQAVFPYANAANNYKHDASYGVPTVTLTVPPAAGISNVYQPVYLLCPNSTILLTEPIVISEPPLNSGLFNMVGTQEFYILLPAGYEFVGAVLPSVQLNGDDFVSSSLSVSFENSTLVRVAYENTGSSSVDNIVISGLQVRGVNDAAPGIIKRFSGNASLGTLLGTNNRLASISLKTSPDLEFTSSFSVDNDFTPYLLFDATSIITAIPDNYVDNDPTLSGQIRLFPLIVQENDYGASFFSGTGVSNDVLTLSAVPKDAPFDITMTHADMNGCVSETAIQHVVYDHNNPISEKLGLGIAPLGTNQTLANLAFERNPFASPPQYVSKPSISLDNPDPLLPEILHNELAGYKLLELFAELPQNTSDQIMKRGTDWEALVAKMPKPIRRILDSNAPLRGGVVLTNYYQDYQWDYSYILNSVAESDSLNTPGGNITTQPYDYFRFETASGSGKYYWKGGSLGKVEFTGVFQNQADLTVIVPFKQQVELFVPPIPLIEATNHKPFAGDTAIFCKDQLTDVLLTGFPRPDGNTSTGYFQIFDAVDHMNIIFNGLDKDIDNDGDADYLEFTDVSGSVSFSASDVTNDFRAMMVVYTYQDIGAPQSGSDTVYIRVTPNPVADFTYSTLCEDIPVEFTNISTIEPAPGTTITSYAWGFGDINSAANSSTDQDPTYTYTTPGLYPNVNLVATSNFGCESVIPKRFDFQIGGTPVVDFSFIGISTEDPIVFRSESSISSNDNYDSLIWTFGDGNETRENYTNQPSNPTGDFIHNYNAAGQYTVNLTVMTDIGCINDASKLVVVVPHVNLDEGGAHYFEDFQDDDGGYQVLGESATPSSWEWGNPQGMVINSNAASDRAWVTNLDGAYLPNEKSALYTASFDIADLTRPIITFNSFRHLGSSDGVVVEYSTDNLNVADPNKTWTTLGAVTDGLPTGVEWYRGVSLAAKPGQEETGFGWTDRDTVWRESKHSLAGIPEAERAQVVFRFSLASVNSDPTQGPDQPDLEGFAVDDLRIGNGTRSVLIENFTNTGVEDVALRQQVVDENQAFREFQETSVGVEVIKIDYHVGFPGEDPFNQENSMDPGARALYYNIASVPEARMDGLPGTSSELPFSEWGQQQFSARVLYLAEADINLNSEITPEGELSVTVNFTPLVDFAQPTLLHVAILEENVTTSDNPALESGRIETGETEFKYVLRKMLPNAAGTKYNTLTGGQATDPVTFTWSNANLFNPEDDIVVVAFLQDESTRRIYQAEIVRGVEDPSVVTGIEDLNASFNVYPNPADKELIVTLPHAPTQSTIIQMFDQMGKVVNEGYFDAGQSTKTISTEDFAGGVYVIQVRSEKGVLRRKVMVVHRN